AFTVYQAGNLPAATRRTRFARTCFVDFDVTTLEFAAVKFLNGLVAVVFVFHFHEAEALGTVGVAIHDDASGADVAIGVEKLFEILVTGGVGKVADINVHLLLSFRAWLGWRCHWTSVPDHSGENKKSVRF